MQAPDVVELMLDPDGRLWEARRREISWNAP